MVEITFDGPSRNETSAATFTDYRLDVKFTPPRGPGFWVPGFFAADGDAANSSAGSGNKWRVRLMPHKEGTWNYEVSFRTGPGIAYDSAVPTTGTTVAPHGKTGSFVVGPSGKDPRGTDYRGKGMLYYVNKHHMQFGESGEYWIMGGPGSPEDMMGFQDFDNTGGHHWNAHSGHFSAADAATYLWKNGTKGHNLLGATKYIADEGMNSLYIIMITAPVGDTKTSFPWISPNADDWEKFDVSKLEQWEYYFSYCDKKGLHLHLLFGETENDSMICGDFSTCDRLKLCYREIVARFAHHHGILWDITEEYDGSAADIKSKTDYLHAVDPYDHPATCHSRNNKVSDRYSGLFGHPTIEAASMQHWCVNVKRDTEYCRNNSAGTRPYCVYVTESNRSVPSCDNNNDVIVDCRRNALWGSLMGGGAGVEWYFGNRSDGWSDLKSNQWDHAHCLWDDTKHALDFFMARGESDRRPVPFQNMRNEDGRFGVPGNWCLYGSDDNGKPCMVVYTDDGGDFSLNVPMAPKYMVGWMNARTGAWQYGSIISGHPGGTIDFTAPGNDEWVLLLYDWSVGTTSAMNPPVISAGPIDSLDAVVNPDNPRTLEAVLSINGIDVKDLILGRTTVDLESHEDHPAADADSFDLTTYASLDDSKVIRIVFDVPVATIFILEMGANDSGFFQPIDADGNPIGNRLAFTGADFRFQETGSLLNNQQAGGIAIVAEVPINGLLILPPADRANSIDPVSVSAVPAKSPVNAHSIIALTPMDADSIVATGSDAKLVSLNGIDVKDLTLGRTTADLESHVDHPAAHADNFDLTTYASLDGSSVIKTVFDVPVATIFILEMGANDSGFFQPIDADGNPIGGRLAFTAADFRYRVNGLLINSPAGEQEVGGIAIVAEVPINGLLILPPADRTNSIDPVSVSAVPAKSPPPPEEGLGFLEEDGFIAIEVERAPLVGDWELETEYSGYTDAGYHIWRSGLTRDQNDNTILAYTIKITNPGDYYFEIRNFHAYDDKTEDNDAFTRMDNGDWVKTFSHVNKEWTWDMGHDFEGVDGKHHVKPPVYENLSAGYHTFYIAARSPNFALDRIHFFREGTQNRPHTEPESSTESGELVTIQLSAVETTPPDTGSDLVRSH
jgi:hypothetical protein